MARKMFEEDAREALDVGNIKEIAFICCKYGIGAGRDPHYGEILNSIVNKLADRGKLNEFMEHFKKFSEDNGYFGKYERLKAPIFIIAGDETCYGVLHYFADCLADALVRCGEKVMITDGRYMPYNGIEDIDNRVLKAVIGFQAPVLYKNFFKNIPTPKIQFWFDNPVFFDRMFEGLDEDYYLLFQDGDYAGFVNKYYNVKNALHVYPGGEVTKEPDYHNREYDVVFLGSYKDYGEIALDDDMNELLSYIMVNPELSFVEATDRFMDDGGIAGRQRNRMDVYSKMTPVYRKIVSLYRKKIIEKVLEADLPVHVYGNSWRAYDGKASDKLIIHEEISAKNMIGELSKAKISLNIMAWHKDGMTERIVNSMLAGAVCLTDGTKYIKEHFSDQENIALYSLTELERLPSIIKQLLSDDESRTKIAKAGYDYAIVNDTWDRRAEEIIEMIS